MMELADTAMWDSVVSSFDGHVILKWDPYWDRCILRRMENSDDCLQTVLASENERVSLPGDRRPIGRIQRALHGAHDRVKAEKGQQNH